MGHIVLATQDLLASATLGAGPTGTYGPVGNLQRRLPSEPVLLTDLASAYITIEWAEAQPINLIAALYCNATAGAATWRVRAAATLAAAVSAPVYDSGSALFAGSDVALRHRSGRRHDWKWLPSGQSHKAWRIDFADAGNADGALILGKLVIDTAWQPARNISYGWSAGLVDPSRKPKAELGQYEPLNRRPYMMTQFDLRFGTEAQMWGSAFEIDQKIGTTMPLLAIRDPDAATYRQAKAVFGLQQDLGQLGNPHFNVFDKRYLIEELLP